MNVLMASVKEHANIVSSSNKEVLMF